jgi:hypothetical protein
MRKLVIVLSVVLSLAAAAGCSKGYVSEKNTGGMTLTLKAERYPLVKGDNTVTVKVADQSGKAVTDAKMDIRFYMPPMPGMAPMDSTTQAVLRGDAYMATVNAPMEGGWKAEVTVTQPGKQPVTATYNLDAR